MYSYSSIVVHQGEHQFSCGDPIKWQMY